MVEKDPSGWVRTGYVYRTTFGKLRKITELEEIAWAVVP